MRWKSPTILIPVRRSDFCVTSGRTNCLRMSSAPVHQDKVRPSLCSLLLPLTLLPLTPLPLATFTTRSALVLLARWYSCSLATLAFCSVLLSHAFRFFYLIAVIYFRGRCSLALHNETGINAVLLTFFSLLRFFLCH